jgi:HEAT repeat protein
MMKRILYSVFVLAIMLSGAARSPAQDKASVAKLIEELKKGDDKAAVALGELGPKAKDAIPALIEWLKKRQGAGDALADNCALALGKIGADAVPPLIELLKDKKAMVAWPHAANALKVMGPTGRAAVPALVEVVKGSTDPLSPCLAMDALAAMGPSAKGAVPALIAVLQQAKLPHPNARTHAVVALGKIGPDAKGATDALNELRGRADPILQLHIDDTLERIGAKKKG